MQTYVKCTTHPTRARVWARVWDMASGAQKSKLEGHTNVVSSVAISSDSTTIVSGSRDKSVRCVWGGVNSHASHMPVGRVGCMANLAFVYIVAAFLKVWDRWKHCICIKIMMCVPQAWPAHDATPHLSMAQTDTFPMHPTRPRDVWDALQI